VGTGILEVGFRGVLDSVPEILRHFNAAVSSGGVAGTTTLLDYTLIGGLLRKNDSIRIWSFWSCDNTANTKNATFSFGGNVFLSNNLSNESSFNAVTIIHNNNSVTAQKAHSKFPQNGISFQEESSAIQVFAVDTTADVNIVLSANGMTATENLILESCTIELVRGT